MEAIDQTTHNGILEIISSFFTETDFLGGTVKLVIRARKYSGNICTPKVLYTSGKITRQFRLTKQNWQLDIPASERPCVYHMLCAVEHTSISGWRSMFKAEIGRRAAKLQLSQKQYQCLYYRNLIDKDEYLDSRDKVCNLRMRFLAL